MNVQVLKQTIGSYLFQLLEKNLFTEPSPLVKQKPVTAATSTVPASNPFGQPAENPGPPLESPTGENR